MDSVLNCLVTDAIGPGEIAERFSKAAREVFGYEFALTIRSPHSALLLALRALGIQAGSTVAVSALAPLFHQIAVIEAGFVPAYLDHDPETCEPLLGTLSGMDPAPSALVLFDAFGILPEPEALRTVGVPVIEDMTQALGAERDGMKAGTFGTFALYGLEDASLVTAGGGALLSANLRRDAQVLRNMAESLPPELLMTDYNAALGIAQLKDLNETIELRRAQESAFRRELARTRHAGFSQRGEGFTGTWAFPVSIESGMRDARVYAKKNGIETEPAFDRSIVSMPDFPEGVCPGARALSLRVLNFPVHQRIGPAHVKTLGRVLATLP